jgi:hypothetical protein
MVFAGNCPLHKLLPQSSVFALRRVLKFTALPFCSGQTHLVEAFAFFMVFPVFLRLGTPMSMDRLEIDLLDCGHSR